MPNEKVVRLLQVKVYRSIATRFCRLFGQISCRTRADKGVEVYYQTTRKDDPNTLLFFAVFESQDEYDSHLRQEHAKRTYAAFQGKLAEEPVRTELVELE